MLDPVAGPGLTIVAVARLLNPSKSQTRGKNDKIVDVFRGQTEEANLREPLRSMERVAAMRLPCRNLDLRYLSAYRADGVF